MFYSTLFKLISFPCTYEVWIEESFEHLFHKAKVIYPAISTLKDTSQPSLTVYQSGCLSPSATESFLQSFISLFPWKKLYYLHFRSIRSVVTIVLCIAKNTHMNKRSWPWLPSSQKMTFLIDFCMWKHSPLCNFKHSNLTTPWFIPQPSTSSCKRKRRKGVMCHIWSKDNAFTSPSLLSESH